MKYIYLLNLVLLVSLNSCKDNSKLETPNIIIIYADDLGYGDVSSYNQGTLNTPNIDKIANQGTRFTSGYSSSATCSPSRYALLTGTYPWRNSEAKIITGGSLIIDTTEITIPKLLKKNGYQTGIVGKWHLGAHETLRPLKRGFDEFFGFLTGGHRYFPHEWDLEDETKVTSQGAAYRTKLLRNEKRIEEKEYLTDALSRESVDFIERNSNDPFFIYLAYNAPHGPLQATDKYLKRYDHIKEKNRKTYAAMVSAVDDGVGDIISKLKEKGIYDNTIIYFLSDNGGRLRGDSDNGELRGKKGNLFEGGIRVPFVMQWPGKIKGGQIYNNPVISLDIFATSKALTSPEISSKNELHGVNLIPFLNLMMEATSPKLLAMPLEPH